MLSSSRPVHPHLARQRPKRVSSTNMAWHTVVLRAWCMVADKRSNSLRVSWKELRAAQVAPCIRSLCVATQNACDRHISPAMRISSGVMVRRACCVAAGRQSDSLRVSGKEECSAHLGLCIRTWRVKGPSVCRPPLWHGTPSFSAHGAWLQASVPTVFGCLGRNYALLR